MGIRSDDDETFAHPPPRPGAPTRFTIPKFSGGAELTECFRVRAPSLGATRFWQYHAQRACRLSWIQIVGDLPEGADVLQIYIGTRELLEKPAPALLFSEVAVGVQFDLALGLEVEPGQFVRVRVEPEQANDLISEVRFILKVPCPF